MTGTRRAPISLNVSQLTANLSIEYDDYYDDCIGDRSLVCSIYDFTIETVMMGLLCVLGFVGNSLSTVCLVRHQSKSATPFLLVSLQFADTLFLIAVVCLRVFPSIYENFPQMLPVSVGYLLPYVGKYGFPCAMIAETGMYN